MTTYTIPSADEIRTTFGKLRAAGKSPKDARNDIRSTIQAALHEANPSPYQFPPSKVLWIIGRHPEPEEVEAARVAGQTIRLCVDATPQEEARFHADRREDYLARHQALLQSASKAHVLAAHEYNANCERDNEVKNGVHFAQKMHQTELWKQTDAAVSAALGVAS